MGEVQCDTFSGDEMYCIFVRYVDTTNEKIKSFKTLNTFEGTFKDKVTHILFYRGLLPTFPRELSELLPNLKYIDIYDCGMKGICADDLKNFKNLERLKLDWNEIQFVPGNLFEFAPKVTQFSFSHNKITKIGPNLLDFLEDPIAVNFIENTAIDYNYRKNIKGSLEELKKVIRNKCKLVKTLEEMAVDVIEKSIDIENSKELLIIAKHLNIESLRNEVETFLNIF